MTLPPEQDESISIPSVTWKPETIKAFADICRSEGLNPVRMRKLVDNYVDTKRKPSRQKLIDALKHRPKIQERAAALGSISKKLSLFLDNLNTST